MPTPSSGFLFSPKVRCPLTVSKVQHSESSAGGELVADRSGGGKLVGSRAQTCSEIGIVRASKQGERRWGDVYCAEIENSLSP